MQACLDYLQVEQDPFKNIGAIVFEHFLHYNCMPVKQFGAQGRVTPKRTDRSGWISNASNFFCLSWLPVSFRKIRSKMKALMCLQHPQHFLALKGKLLVTLKLIVESSRDSNSSEILCMSW